jgi:ribosomal protein S18 acetylase RimI-like enzyme
LCRAEILTIRGWSFRPTGGPERCSDSLTSFIQSDPRDLALRRSGSRPTHGAKARIDEETDVPKLTSAVQYVDATHRDADSIASLHADSWRRHYRGAYLDAYLDGDVGTDRQGMWRSRLADPAQGEITVVARRDGEILGFAHTIVDADPLWGSLLENLHVRSDLKRNGVGSRLLSETAERLVRLRPAGSLHLWVLRQNTAAQAFYTARGGSRVETDLRGPFPGGGHALGHRYHWADPTRLLVGP